MLEYLQCCSSHLLGSGTCKCESDRNILVLNLFARSFQFRLYGLFSDGCVMTPSYVLVKREQDSKKSNAKNELVATKKRKSRQDAKEDKKLDLLFRS